MVSEVCVQKLKRMGCMWMGLGTALCSCSHSPVSEALWAVREAVWYQEQINLKEN